MSKPQLSFLQSLLIGSMLFGLFFGAGNLIFPLHLGQEAGAAMPAANLGFMLTAIGLPFLGIIAMGISRCSGLFELASQVHPRYAQIFTLLLYMTIGPLFALPRTAAVSFEIGFADSISTEAKPWLLSLFAAGFFILALLFALKPGRIITFVGKYLNPLFLILLGILMIAVIIAPMGSVSNAPVQSAYADTPLLKGLTEGYNTMDALASLAFGIIVINAVKGFGINDPKAIAVSTVKAGAVVIILMAVIYTFLAWAGAQSISVMPFSSNGGIAFAQISEYYFGAAGQIILALTVTVACLKTAIGLISACASTLHSMYPHALNYKYWAYLIALISFAVSILGLDEIIYLAVPCLMLLYPLAITLIMLTFICVRLGPCPQIYTCVTALTLIAALGDFLHALPEALTKLETVQRIIGFYQQILPGFTQGMGWVLPAIIGLALGSVWLYLSRKRTATH